MDAPSNLKNEVFQMDDFSYNRRYNRWKYKNIVVYISQKNDTHSIDRRGSDRDDKREDENRPVPYMDRHGSAFAGICGFTGSTGAGGADYD